MSMGCGMFPMIFPGVQQYMPTMGMGIGMGMGMGMEMGINRPMFPFPNMLAGSGLPTGAAAHLGPRFPMPAFMPHVPVPDPSRIQSNQSEQMLNSLGAQHPSQSWFPNFTDPYQQYVAPHQMQLPLSQVIFLLNLASELGLRCVCETSFPPLCNIILPLT